VKAAGEIPLAAAGGASAAPAVAQFANQVRDYAAEEKKKADDAATQDAWAKAVQTRNRFVYDPQMGLQSRRGKDALKAKDDLLPQFDKELDGLEADLGNDSQREVFRKMRAQQRLEFEGSIDQHTAGEIRQLEEDSFKSAVSTAISDGIFNYRQPGKVKGTKQVLQSAIMDRAEKMGWDADITRQAVEQATSQMHKGIVFRELANDNDQAAAAWYSKVKGEVTGEDATDIEARLRPAQDRGNGRRVAQEYLAKFADEGKALAALRADHGDKDYFDQARAQVQQGFDDRKLLNHQQYGASLNEALDKFNSGGTPSDYQLGNLSAQDQRMFQKLMSQRAKGIPVRTDDVELFKLKQLAVSDPGEFMQTHLGQYADCLSPADLKDLRELQMSMTKGDPAADKTINGFMSISQVVDNELEVAGEPKPDKKDAAAFQRRAKIEAEVDRGVADWKRQNGGKEPPHEVIQEIVHRLMRRLPTGGMFGGSIRAFDLTVKQVPERFKKQLDEQYIKAGITRPPTAQEYVQNYLMQTPSEEK
jgi:hypothetical protein